VGFVRGLLAAVILGGVFGSATATIELIDGDLMMLSIEVEVSGSPDTVIAHLTFEDDQALILPLLDRGDGTFGLRTELEPKNFFVVFEAVGEGTETSDPVSLAQMGAEFGTRSGGTTTTMPEDELSNESRRALWLAVALGAGSLSLLAVWVLGSRDEDEEEIEEHQDSDEEE
jgi:hypothetical protein